MRTSGSVHIAVRPEQLEFRAGREPNAEVVEREFRGHDVLYRLRHEAGRTLLVQLPSLELYEPGPARVRPPGRIGPRARRRLAAPRAARTSCAIRSGVACSTGKPMRWNPRSSTRTIRA